MYMYTYIYTYIHIYKFIYIGFRVKGLTQRKSEPGGRGAWARSCSQR